MEIESTVLFLWVITLVILASLVLVNFIAGGALLLQDIREIWRRREENRRRTEEYLKRIRSEEK